MTRAVITRVLSTAHTPGDRYLVAVGRRIEVAVAPLPATVVVHGQLELGIVELRPVAVAEVQLSVGKLPQQEVADATLATGADAQVGHGRITQADVLLHQLDVDIGGTQRALLHLESDLAGGV